MSGIPFGADLDAGLAEVSGTQTVTFTLYRRLILPLDGFVYWVRSDNVSASAMNNAAGFNQVYWNQPISQTIPAPVIIARGSYHIAAQKVQDETETYGINQVTFTSDDPIHQDFNQINSSMMYIGIFGDRQFAFSNRANFFVQAGIWHYTGDAVYPFMQTQIIDGLTGINASQLVVSNSLPLWLNLNNYTPFYGFGNQVPLYPSKLVEPNIAPPFGSVHVYPEGTEALQSVRRLGWFSTHRQLCRDRVKVTFYGLTNYGVMNFLDCFLQYSQDYSFLGLMNDPVPRDEKVDQNELSIIAMKKSIYFEVSYNQLQVRHIARQIIGQALVGITVEEERAPMAPPVTPPVVTPDTDLWFIFMALSI